MPRDHERYQTDYILVKKQFRNQVKDSRSYPIADIDSDHNLVMMTCKLKFKKIETNGQTRWNVERMQLSEVLSDYNSKIENCLMSELNTEHRMTWAAEEVRKETSREQKQWITEKILNLIARCSLTS